MRHGSPAAGPFSIQSSVQKVTESMLYFVSNSLNCGLLFIYSYSKRNQNVFFAKTLHETSFLSAVKSTFFSFFIPTLLIVSCQIIINGVTALLGNSSNLTFLFSQSPHCKFPSASLLSCAGLTPAYNRQVWFVTGLYYLAADSNFRRGV